jgi:DNA-binding helix-hairpin-helix protein with protein kinase domain
VAVWPRVRREEARRADLAVSVNKAEWERIKGAWNKEASLDRFNLLRDELERAKLLLAEIPNERVRRMALLHKDQAKRQFDHYLDRFRLDRASIPGIGPGRTSMLAAYGIETALDVERQKIMAIPGFGETLARELLAWRRKHEQSFRFNPTLGVDPAEQQALEHELKARKHQYLQSLQSGAQRLRVTRDDILAARARLAPQLKRSWDELMIAQKSRDTL